ncbi:unnamed protein product, partial [Pylaiella littoralis]
MTLDASSAIVVSDTAKSDGHFVFRLTSTGSPRGEFKTMWKIDAGSSAGLDEWVKLVGETISQARADGDEAEIQD